MHESLRPSLLIVAAVSLGVVLRAFLYAGNRSFTLDESFVGLNVARHSARGLLGRLDWNSAAPIGFLELNKFLTVTLGTSEYVLRAPALVASLLSIFVFAGLARHLGSRTESLLAVLLFVVLALPISYAALAKPYAFDLLAATVLFLATLNVLARPASMTTLATLAIAGVAAPVFSYASVFSVAASGTVLIVTALQHDVPNLVRRRLLCLMGLWAVLLVVAYVWHRNSFQHLQRTFGTGHLRSLQSLRDVVGAVRIVLGVSPESSSVGAIVMGIAAVGTALLLAYGVWVLTRRRWQLAAMVVLPGIFAAIGSAAGLYPLVPRTMLFLVPGLVVAIASGAVASFRGSHSLVTRVVTVVVLLSFAISEVAASARVLEPAYRDVGMKPVLRALANDGHGSPAVYFGYAPQYPFAFYLTCHCAGDVARRALKDRARDVVPVPGTVGQWSPALASHSPNVIFGAFHGYGVSSYYRDVAALRGRGRVWVVVSFLNDGERRELVARLDRLGRRIDSVRRGKGVDAVDAFLYDFHGHGGG